MSKEWRAVGEVEPRDRRSGLRKLTTSEEEEEKRPRRLLRTHDARPDAKEDPLLVALGERAVALADSGAAVFILFILAGRHFVLLSFASLSRVRRMGFRCPAHVTVLRTSGRSPKGLSLLRKTCVSVLLS